MIILPPPALIVAPITTPVEIAEFPTAHPLPALMVPLPPPMVILPPLVVMLAET